MSNINITDDYKLFTYKMVNDINSNKEMYLLPRKIVCEDIETFTILKDYFNASRIKISTNVTNLKITVNV